MASKCWEYTFCLHTCRLGDRVRHMTNPFTGQPIITHIDDGLSSSEVESVKGLLSSRGATRDSDDEFYNVSFSDDSHMSLGFGELDGSQPVVGAEVDIVCRHLTEELLDFVFTLAMAANMAIVETFGSVALTRSSTDPRIKQRWPRAVVISTTGELERWLKEIVGGRRVTR